MSEKRVVIVTGASSGFGRLTANRLVEEGFEVVGTSRNPEATAENFEMFTLDVASDESVAAFVSQVKERFSRINVLINNAGQSHNSLLEETTFEDARQIFETNFWGMVRMNQAVLPLMRQQGSGLIVTISSLAGLVGTPGQGFYGAAKHAIEGYTETLRAELGPFPVEVALIQPGFFRTKLGDSMVRNANAISDYDSVREKVAGKLDEGIAGGGDPAEVVEAILKTIRQGGGRLRCLVGSDARTITRLKRWLPESWFLEGLRKQFGLK